MYKLILCWRYLLTRYIALASVVSVMLGVATMIVVNAVMLGFTNEMQVRIHGILSDVIFESSGSLNGFADPELRMEQIRAAAGDMIEEMTPTIIVPAMLTYRVGLEGQPRSQPVELIGIDATKHGKVSEILSYLQHPENRKELSFDLKRGGYDMQGAGKDGGGVLRYEMETAGWGYRRYVFAEQEKMRKRREEDEIRLRKQIQPEAHSLSPGSPSGSPESAKHFSAYGNPANGSANEEAQPVDPFSANPSGPPAKIFDPAREQHAGVILGINLSAFGRSDQPNPQTGKKEVHERLAVLPGDDVLITFPTASLPLKLQSDGFTVVDLYESKMMEYDSRLVFVPIERLQHLRGMYDPATGKPMVSQILIKAKPGADLNEIRDRIQAVFPPEVFLVSTWRDKQESLLAAVANELAMLNVLLYLIFAVAGFGILAIFYMIVVEKTKDIGIMKSLGAGGIGVMQIFLYYSLLLGIVGSALGLGMGLLFVKYIKEIANFLSYFSKSELFSPEIYSFYEIPTIVEPLVVLRIIFAALLIAVLSGVLPAVRAARLHPVESLRS